jgi:chromosome segregation ATPase
MEPSRTSRSRSDEHPQPASTSSVLDFSDIDQKQQELRSAVSHRIALLERTLMSRDQEVSLLRSQLRKLEEDYKYNYNLIAQRDAELDEAAQQLQLLHVEAKAAREDAAGHVQKIRTLEDRNKDLQSRLMQQHLACEAKLSDMKRTVEAAVAQQQQAVVAHESKLESEKEELQRNFLSRMRSDESARAVVIQQAELHLAEKEQIWKRQEQALHDELREQGTRLSNTEREREELRARLRAEEAEHEQQRLVLEARIRSLETDLAHRGVEKASLEERLNDSQRVQQTSAALEVSLRTSSARIQALELEESRLVSELAAAQQRVQQFTLQRDDELKRFTTECEAVAARYAASMKIRDDSLAESDAKNHRLAIELADVKARLAEGKLSVERAAHEASMAKERAADADRAAQERYAETEKIKNELSAARADIFRLQSQLSDEKRHSTEVEHKAHATVDRHRRDLEAALQKLDATAAAAVEDTSRLTRELHSSEAARRALEQQLTAQLDDRSLIRMVDALRIEKSELEQKVAGLERTNESIRTQVATFTAELQNDPVVRGAKEVAEKLADAERHLREEKEKVEQLQAALREKDNEVVRYQREILSVKADAQAHQLVADDALRRAASTSRSASATAAARRGAADDDCDDDFLLDQQPLLKEAQLWRLRTQQLEGVLREAVAERDAARREVLQCRAAIQSLTSEKNSLTDINSLLRTQLKQAYVWPVQSQPQPSPASASQPPPGTTASAVDRVVREQSSRIASLETELAHCKTHSSVEPAPAVAPAAGSQRDGGPSASRSKPQAPGPALRPSSASNARSASQGPVKRVGNVAIRHYGFPA